MATLIPEGPNESVGIQSDRFKNGWFEEINFDTVSDTFYDDLRFPAQGINPAGSAAPPTVDNGAVFPGTLIFSGSADNVIGGVAQLPHSWKEGTPIYPHIHWAKVLEDTDGLAVTWQFKYKIANVGGVFGAMSEASNGTLTAGDLTSADKHNLTSFTAIDMTGKTLSSIIVWELRRVGTDAYTGTVRLFELDFHYEVDSFGSGEEYIK